MRKFSRTERSEWPDKRDRMLKTIDKNFKKNKQGEGQERKDY